MKFGCLTEKGKAEIRERDLPQLGDYDVLVDMKACNICTTDYQQWMGLREHQGYPMAGGHEASGIIVEIGAKVKDFKVGDQIATGYEGCGNCEACRSGMADQCADLKKGTEDGYKGGWFGFSDYTVKSVRGIYKVSDRVSPSEAGFLEPLATVIHGAKKLRIRPFETVVVIGAGTMGLLNAQTARAYGARVIVTELMEKKLNTAKTMGFEVVDSSRQDPVQAVMELTEGEGADAVIVAVGATQANDQGLRMLKKNDGRLLLFAAGYPAPEIDVDPNAMHYRRMEVIGTFGASTEDFQDAAKGLGTGVIDVSALIEKRTYSLEQMQEAFAEASKPGMYRVSVLLG